VRVLLDECIDWRLSRDIVGHDVKTLSQRGWTSTGDGTLLALAAEHFDVFVTVDRNLSFQQHLISFSVAVVVLHARTNRLAELRLLLPELHAAIETATPGAARIGGGG
jgi:hypothetical protein